MRKITADLFIPLDSVAEDAGGEDAGLAEKLGDARKVVVSNQELLGNNPYVTDGVQRSLGRPPCDFADHAAQTAATGVWTPTDPTDQRSSGGLR